MQRENAVAQKSMEFAVRIVRLCRYLEETKGEKVLAKQLLRSGTSVGANIREGMYGQSRKDFAAKMGIALKEAVETEYWLELLYRTEYLDDREYGSIRAECSKVARLLNAIVRSAKTGG